ncbi:hypothetical protein RhiirA1_495770 [Rhizophagus irregularis]|uniref:Protein kinase domain-containing protein n=1 Tax=Rhizophagus irregularis TaxID=588596 RepID=A0A2N0R501_9GLOM|nr:hypothetical protein RhiirA1_495770 [Rhizophagus irregularis]
MAYFICVYVYEKKFTQNMIIKKSYIEDHYVKELNGLLKNKIIERYSHDLIHFKYIGSGGFASVYVAKWNNTPTKYAIKKFVNNKEVYLTKMVNPHANIICFYGVTKKEVVLFSKEYKS